MRESFLDSRGRNPARIQEVLEEIKLIWIKNSDLRLGQLICIASNNTDIFSIEDEELLNKLILMRGGD